MELNDFAGNNKFFNIVYKEILLNTATPRAVINVNEVTGES